MVTGDILDHVKTFVPIALKGSCLNLKVPDEHWALFQECVFEVQSKILAELITFVLNLGQFIIEI